MGNMAEPDLVKRSQCRVVRGAGEDTPQQAEAYLSQENHSSYYSFASALERILRGETALVRHGRRACSSIHSPPDEAIYKDRLDCVISNSEQSGRTRKEE